MNKELGRIKINKKSLNKERLFSVDPARFALASLLTKGRILLHKLQARIHALIFYHNLIKNKVPAEQRPYLVSSKSVVYTNPTFATIIANTKGMSRSLC